MSDKRTRFDALAEELFEEEKKPEPKPRTKRTKIKDDDDAERPSAYLSVQGQLHPVDEFSITSQMNYAREAEFFGMAFREPTHTMTLKLPGRVMNLMQVNPDGIVFVIMEREEPRYFKLAVRDVSWTVTDRKAYTTVEANCIEVS